MTVFMSLGAPYKLCKNPSVVLIIGLERYWYWVIGYWAIFTDTG